MCLSCRLCPIAGNRRARMEAEGVEKGGPPAKRRKATAPLTASATFQVRRMCGLNRGHRGSEQREVAFYDHC